jgi:hypothetical protein
MCACMQVSQSASELLLRFWAALQGQTTGAEVASFIQQKCILYLNRVKAAHMDSSSSSSGTSRARQQQYSADLIRFIRCMNWYCGLLCYTNAISSTETLKHLRYVIALQLLS